MANLQEKNHIPIVEINYLVIDFIGLKIAIYHNFPVITITPSPVEEASSPIVSEANYVQYYLQT